MRTQTTIYISLEGEPNATALLVKQLTATVSETLIEVGEDLFIRETTITSNRPPEPLPAAEPYRARDLDANL